MEAKDQIEELTNELVRTSRYGTHSAVAEHLYNKGWRKQSDGEWITETTDWVYDVKKTYCSKCGTNARYDNFMREYILTNFCPHCGAKMKGSTNEKTD